MRVWNTREADVAGTAAETPFIRRPFEGPRMTLKASGEGDLQVSDRWGGGVGWFAHPDEAMQRASHALATDAGVYVVDPVDAPDVDDLVADLGEVAGVVVLLDRHKRDAAAVATRHDVPVYVPTWMSGVAGELDARVERLGGELPGTAYEVRRLVNNRFWQEAFLYDGSTLVVPEALGTSHYFLAGEERVGVHPMLRLTPPTRLRDLRADRLLVGHGAGLHDDAGAAIEDAVDNSRRRTPSLWLRTLREFVG